MYYHASQTPNIKTLEPRISNHGIPLIYFSTKRENVLVYLSNAVEKYCKDTGFDYDGKWQKWGPYGFNDNGILRLEEYYPNAIESTYKGVSGYIYSANSIVEADFEVKIPYAACSSNPVDVESIEFVSDAYDIKHSLQSLHALRVPLIGLKRCREAGLPGTLLLLL